MLPQEPIIDFEACHYCRDWSTRDPVFATISCVPTSPHAYTDVSYLRFVPIFNEIEATSAAHPVANGLSVICIHKAKHIQRCVTTGAFEQDHDQSGRGRLSYEFAFYIYEILGRQWVHVAPLYEVNGAGAAEISHTKSKDLLEVLAHQSYHRADTAESDGEDCMRLWRCLMDDHLLQDTGKCVYDSRRVPLAKESHSWTWTPNGGTEVSQASHDCVKCSAERERFDQRLRAAAEAVPKFTFADPRVLAPVNA